MKPHERRIEDVARVDDAAVCDECAELVRVELAVFLPFREQEYDGSAGRGLLGSLGHRERGELSLSVRHRFGVVNADIGPFDLQRRRDVQCGRVAHVVAVGLEGRAQAGDRDVANVAAREFARELDGAGAG